MLRLQSTRKYTHFLPPRRRPTKNSIFPMLPYLTSLARWARWGSSEAYVGISFFAPMIKSHNINASSPKRAGKVKLYLAPPCFLHREKWEIRLLNFQSLVNVASKMGSSEAYVGISFFAPMIKSHNINASSPKRAGKAILYLAPPCFLHREKWEIRLLNFQSLVNVASKMGSSEHYCLP